MISINSKPIPCEGFCIRELDDELLFIDETGDGLHSMNFVGNFIWQHINGNTSIKEILDAVCEEFDVERNLAEEDLKKFLRDLYHKKIIRFEE